MSQREPREMEVAGERSVLRRIRRGQTSYMMLAATNNKKEEIVR